VAPATDQRRQLPAALLLQSRGRHAAASRGIEPRDNLRVPVGEAEYGRPEI
jgi:hypothetical protein